VFGISEFVDVLQDEAQSGQSRDGSGKECDEVTFADPGILGTFLDECLIARISFEFGAMSRFREWVMFDVGLILIAPQQRCYRQAILRAQPKEKLQKLTVKDNVSYTLHQRVLFSLSREKGTEHTLVMREYIMKIPEHFRQEARETVVRYHRWGCIFQRVDENLSIKFIRYSIAAISPISPLRQAPYREHNLSLI
jgi:hypothetical protein